MAVPHKIISNCALSDFTIAWNSVHLYGYCMSKKIAWFVQFLLQPSIEYLFPSSTARKVLEIFISVWCFTNQFQDCSWCVWIYEQSQAFCPVLNNGNKTFTCLLLQQGFDIKEILIGVPGNIYWDCACFQVFSAMETPFHCLHSSLESWLSLWHPLNNFITLVSQMSSWYRKFLQLSCQIGCNFSSQKCLNIFQINFSFINSVSLILKNGFGNFQNVIQIATIERYSFMEF